jgi:hypothetical protein
MTEHGLQDYQYTYAPIAQRQSNGLLIRGSRYRNSLGVLRASGVTTIPHVDVRGLVVRVHGALKPMDRINSPDLFAKFNMPS